MCDKPMVGTFTSSAEGLVHDFRGMSDYDLYRNSDDISLNIGDTLVYDDAAFVVEKAVQGSCAEEFYDSCGGCAFLPHTVAERLTSMDDAARDEQLTALEKWNLYDRAGYHSASPCFASPLCFDGTNDLIYKCVASSVPWFIAEK